MVTLREQNSLLSPLWWSLLILKLTLHESRVILFKLPSSFKTMMVNYTLPGLYIHKSGLVCIIRHTSQNILYYTCMCAFVYYDEWQNTTRYMHAHHVPHAEHVGSSKCRGEA